MNRTRLPGRRAAVCAAAFTLGELLTVITIIVILVGLIVGAAGYANTKASRSRAETEIKALSAAAENYKSDNGVYPRSPSPPKPAAYTDNLDARTQGDPSDAAYKNASRDLYALLSGQVDATTGTPDSSPKYPRSTTATGTNYWGDLKPNMLGRSASGSTTISTINDPYGLSYGYSTAYQADLDNGTNPPGRGYNPTFDLWSVANKPGITNQAVWITNW